MICGCMTFGSEKDDTTKNGQVLLSPWIDTQRDDSKEYIITLFTF